MAGSCIIKLSKALLCFFKAGLVLLLCSSFFPLPLQIPEEEQNELKLLFRTLFADNDLGYTLFGDKPMSFCYLSTCAPGISTHDEIFKIYQKGRIPLLPGLAALQKLPIRNDNYTFIIYEKNGIPDLIIIINKKSLHSVFHNNIDVFKKKYGDDETFLSSLEEKKFDLEDLFQNHLALGILLGYGRKNAELFQRREHLLNNQMRIPLAFNPPPSLSFCSVDEELCALDRLLKPIRHGNYLLLLVQPIHFVGDLSSQETLQLQSQYRTTHKQLTQLFSQKDWFQIILNRLTYYF